MFANERYFTKEGVTGIIQRTLNMVDPRLINHGARVAYLASLMMKKNDTLSTVQKRNVHLLCMFHDIGAYKAEEIQDLFELQAKSYWPHCVHGYLFLQHFSFLKQQAQAVLFHHLPWRRLMYMREISLENKLLAQMINIADRCDVYLETTKCGEEAFRAWLEKQKEGEFYPALVDALLDSDLTGCFDPEKKEFKGFVNILLTATLTTEETAKALELLVFSIDFRSSHTVTHTITTASISRGIASRMHLRAEDVEDIICGALLHDLGKVGIPVEILEKPGKLTAEEMDIMRTHVDLTREILGQSVPPKVVEIALRHHEKLDGTGYPCGILGKELTLAERIVAVSDLVSALYSSRSYKNAFPKDRTVSILEENVTDGKIDAGVVAVVTAHYDEIIEEVKKECKPLLNIYHQMEGEYKAIEGKLVDMGYWKIQK